MKLLLDESVPVQLRNLLVEHDVWSVRYRGWDSKHNGELLALARDEFDALITVDRSIPYQQNITEGDVSVIVLTATTNRIRDLEPLMPQILEVLRDLKRGQIVHIG